MKKYASLLTISALLMTSSMAKADDNGALGALLGAAAGGYAGSKATDNGKPIKNGAAYGAATGAILGALLAPSDAPTATEGKGDSQRSIPQQAYMPPQIVYVVTGPQAYTNVRVMTQEQAYWQGYRDAQQYRSYYPRYGCEYGGFRYREDYCRH